MKYAILLAILSLIVVAVIGMYASDFTAYLGNNPTTCNNCHVMDAAFESWFHAGHKNWAVCNDCHTPHALIPKYYVKALSGYHHVSAFVLGDIPNAIRAKETSREVIQENCIRCHEDTVQNINMSASLYPNETERQCFQCHRSVAHGNRGISILPYKDSE